MASSLLLGAVGGTLLQFFFRWFPVASTWYSQLPGEISAGWLTKRSVAIGANLVVALAIVGGACGGLGDIVLWILTQLSAEELVIQCTSFDILSLLQVFIGSIMGQQTAHRITGSTRTAG